MFWVFKVFFAGAFDIIINHDPPSQVSRVKNELAGTAMRNASTETYAHFLPGRDHLARDVFSPMIAGSTVVILIAPLATLFAFLAGITLELPAGYYV